MNIKKNAAFTLIELLVVVLIIGILAAIALPQYQKAVAKARLTEGIVILNALEKAQWEYKMANGVYADLSDEDNFESLSIDFSSHKDNLHCSSLFCQYRVKNLGAIAYFEWVWDWGVEDERHRCLSKDDLGKQICASYGGRLFREDAVASYYTVP